MPGESVIQIPTVLQCFFPGNYSSYYMKGLDTHFGRLLVASQQSSVDRLNKEKKSIEKEKKETEEKLDKLE